MDWNGQDNSFSFHFLLQDWFSRVKDQNTYIKPGKYSVCLASSRQTKILWCLRTRQVSCHLLAENVLLLTINENVFFCSLMFNREPPTTRWFIGLQFEKKGRCGFSHVNIYLPTLTLPCYFLPCNCDSKASVQKQIFRMRMRKK